MYNSYYKQYVVMYVRNLLFPLLPLLLKYPLLFLSSWSLHIVQDHQTVPMIQSLACVRYAELCSYEKIHNIT